MDVFGLRDRLIDDYSSYIRSFIQIRDNRIQDLVDSELAGGLLWPDPLIQLNPSFEPGYRTDQLVDQRILHEECRRIFRMNKESGEGQSLRLHRHQEEAVRVARIGANYVLTTGTGSGKSLAYIVPIVDHVLRRGPGRGIQAIVVYPMNALANSQLGELRKFLGHGYPDGRGPVTFERYTGQEKDEEKQRIMANPPDILLTNYVMLELILTRPDERRTLVQAAQGLHFLVLDELHTYRGRQGADVAMLVRRVRDALNAENLQCVGTSASQRKLITVGTVHSQALRLAREVDSLLAPADEERIAKLIERFQDFGGAQFDKDFLLAEWTGVVENRGILSWDEYRDAQRTGRGRGLQVRERQAIWKVFQQVYEELADKRLAPWTQICRKAAEAIQTGRVRSPFDAVVIDEVQDLKPQEIRFLAVLAAKNPGNLMLIGDAGQRIYPGGYSLRSLGIDVRGRSHVLRINYRTTEQIRRFADRILPELADDLDGGTETRKGTKSLLKGPAPTLRGFTTSKEQDAFIAQHVRHLFGQGLQPREIAVFARIGSRLESLQKALAAAGISSQLLSRDEESTQTEAIHLGTMHRAKGLEYKVVFVYDCSEGVVPHMTTLRRSKDPADYDAARAREQQLLYVSLTRARDEVFVTWAGLPSPFLQPVGAP